MESLRLLHVLAPAAFGGLERVVELLAIGLTERGHDVTVAGLMGEGADEPAVLGVLRGAGVRVAGIALPHRAYRREREAVRSVITALRPQVVHTHGYRPDVLLRGVIQHAGVPAVATAHGFTGGDLKNRVFEWLQVRAFAGFDGVVAVSGPLRDRLVAAGVPAGRVHLIPNAFAPGAAALDRVAAREALGLGSQAIIIGWIGRFTREKGADLAVRALARLARPDVNLALVGAGREEPGLRALAEELGVTGQVVWLGTRPEAARYLLAFDLLLLSSRTEGTPMVLLEAMAAGTPIVAAAVGGIPDLLAEGEAVLVPPEAPAALATGIARVLDDTGAAQERAALARHRLERDFAIGPWLDRHEVLYRSVLRSTTPGAA